MSFLFKTERPPYEVLNKLDKHIEIRKYGPSKWARTSVHGDAGDMRDYSGSMFGKLFRYISGENDANQKISMTSPVLYDIKSNQIVDKSTKCEISMGFYVPQKLQQSTPKPIGDAYLEDKPSMIVACITFGGYASMSDYIKHRDELIQRLGSEASKYDCVNMMLAGYDPPFKPVGRTNEVWLRKIL